MVESLADGTASRRRSEGERTNGSRLDHVADGESLDRLVLWCTSGAVGAANWVHMSTSLLVTSTTDRISVEVLYRLLQTREIAGLIVLGSALLDHFCGFYRLQLESVV